MRALLALPLLIIATPLAAQTTISAIEATQDMPSTDRIAAAKPVVDKLWPLGSFQRMFDGDKKRLADTLIAVMFDIKIEEMLPDKHIGDHERGKSLGELTFVKDPHYRERTQIITTLTFDEMLPLLEQVEPTVREGLVISYAQKYTPAQLRELDKFLSTGTGKIYAKNWLTNLYNPGMVQALRRFIPDFIKAMPDLFDKVEAATAHITPPRQVIEDEAVDAAASAAEAAASAADAAASEAVDETIGWSKYDLNKLAQLNDAQVRAEDQMILSNYRIELHYLEAKERSGKMLNEDEIETRDYLRDRLKEKK